jgi:hypothetical protein
MNRINLPADKRLNKELKQKVKAPTIKEVKDDLADACGLNLSNQAKGLCIKCGEPALAKCHSEAGRREFFISGMCEPCFDALFEGEE